jgi:hypothetical protein
MKKHLLLLIVVFGVAATSSFTHAQTNNDSGRLSIISEYGPFFGRNTIGFTGIFVTGYTFPNQKEMLGLGLGYETAVDYGQGFPIFLNFRHTFSPEKDFTPFVNVSLGTRYKLADYRYYYDISLPYLEEKPSFGYYMVVSSGFQARKFSFSGGMFFKSISNDDFFVGLEIKCGYKF